MRIKDPFPEGEEPYNLVPLTDMVFNLLIFFMAATTFAQVEKEMGVQLPHATSFASLSSAPQQLVINVDQEGQPIVRRQKYDLESLQKLVSDALKQNANVSVVIRADLNGRVEGFDKVADVCKRAGIGKITISYLPGGTAGK